MLKQCGAIYWPGTILALYYKTQIKFFQTNIYFNKLKVPKDGVAKGAANLLVPLMCKILTTRQISP